MIKGLIILSLVPWLAFADDFTAPVADETCFSPDMPCDQKIIKFISSAQKSIEMAIYSINLEGLTEELIRQAERIPVHLVVDKGQAGGKNSAVKRLRDGGVEVRFGNQHGYMHNKFAIVDEKIVETGSYNYTNHATQANQENQYYVDRPQVVKAYVDRFDKIWQSAVK